MAKEDGEYIEIVFSQDLIGTIDQVSDAAHFSIDFNETGFAPYGPSVSAHRVPERVYKVSGSDNAILLQFPSGNVNCFRNAVGNITIHYDGAGSLRGEGGTVQAFDWTFTPYDLLAKPNQNEMENISTEIDVRYNLFDVTWRYGYEYENISVSIVPFGTLTRVEDL